MVIETPWWLILPFSLIIIQYIFLKDYDGLVCTPSTCAVAAETSYKPFIVKFGLGPSLFLIPPLWPGFRGHPF